MEDKTKNKIKKVVSENIDNLEDQLNFRLREILNEIDVKDENAITYARQVFFQG